MQTGEPSRTARAAAFHRAAHQVLEGGRIFADPLALRILGEDAEAVAQEAEKHPSGRRMRIFIAVRTRFAEDALAAAVERGVRQLVVLGAGLDTYAYRGAVRERLRIFEVDHPATQAWKRQRLADAGIAVPAWLTFAPVNFEPGKPGTDGCVRDGAADQGRTRLSPVLPLSEGLAAAGFDCEQQTFFTWLGVVPYLTEEAVWSTLGFITSLPGGAHVVFDYGDPPDSLSPEMRVFHDRGAARVAELGEAWRTWFEPDQLRARLMGLGFTEVVDLGPPQFAARYFPHRAASVSDRGGHIVHAAKV